ncbi:hypothetical protein AKI39_12570 [Bordetella sp. H567]|uniref:DUF3300 domain-containing protein n=1 Tax=Bordetella sp. H567 TaxID=1697043 RepID=UPI00081CE248|nr:DUF3300 domain-containing protein [Bordetella sp. H567]AOB31342.1 hypothetical protein AKI39_12570 [Bordetella sp. H567]
MASWYGRGACAILIWLVTFTACPADSPDATPAFKPEEIEALVAPIALYPDTLLSQVLMASTYPLEIVHAGRWIRENPNLRGDAAVKAVEQMPWDVSVKSLVAFPQILAPMNDKLDWTQKLGDAFLAQPSDVFAAVQRLRGRAQASGNLQSNPQQTVSVEPAPAGGQAQVLRIESADPQVIYVPAYNPTVAYGGWSSPSYPPTYWPPPPAYYPGTALMSGLAWGVGIAAAGAIFSDCNWGGGDVDIDYNKVTNIDRNFDRSKVQGQGGRWQHDPGHRQGVAYRDNASRQQYAGAVPGADRRAEYRGRDAAGANQRAADRANAGGRTAGAGGPANANRAEGAAQRGAAGNRPSGANSPGAGNRSTGPDRSTAANRPASADRPSSANRPTSADRPSSANRPTSAERPSSANRPASADRPSSANRGAVNNPAGGRANQAGGANRGATSGTAGGGRDSAFAGVGGGGNSAQRSYDRGRSSAQSSGANRGGGGRSGGGGGGGGGGRGGGRR